MENPFDILNERLIRIEGLLTALFSPAVATTTASGLASPEVGGIPLAQEITRLSPSRIYSLVSERAIPHSKRGNRLYFNRTELLNWVAEDKRPAK